MTESLLIAPGLPAVQPGPSYKNTLSGSWVQDSAANVWWLETSTDLDGNIIYTYYGQPGGTPSVPVGSVEPVQDSNIQVIRRGDDVNGDGSLVVTFFRVNVYDEDGAILSSNPQTSAGGPYVVIGTEIDPQDEVEELLRVGNANTTDIKTASESTNDVTVGRLAGSFINFEFDEVVISRVTVGPATGEIETAEYKLSTVTVGTITISYDANGDVSNVARS